MDVDALGLDVAGRLEDGARLHPGDLGVDDAQAAAAQAEHRVVLVQVVDRVGHGLGRDAELLGDLFLALGVVRQELVQRRVEGADGDRPLAHHPEDAGEVAALDGQELGEGLLALFTSGGQDHLAHGDDAVAAEEHVLGAAQADALGAEGDRVGRLVGLVGVGADEQLTLLVRPPHDLGVVAVRLALVGLHRALEQHLQHLGRARLELADDDLADEAVDRDPVALFDLDVVDREGALGHVDVELAAADDADLAHLPRDQGRVAGHAALGGEDALGRVHAADVFGAREVAHQQHLLAALGPGHRVGGAEDDAAGGRAGAGRQAAGQGLARLFRRLLVLGAEHRPQELVQLVGLDAHERLFAGRSGPGRPCRRRCGWRRGRCACRCGSAA